MASEYTLADSTPCTTARGGSGCRTSPARPAASRSPPPGPRTLASAAPPCPRAAQQWQLRIVGPQRSPAMRQQNRRVLIWRQDAPWMTPCCHEQCSWPEPWEAVATSASAHLVVSRMRRTWTMTATKPAASHLSPSRNALMPGTSCSLRTAASSEIASAEQPTTSRRLKQTECDLRCCFAGRALRSADGRRLPKLDNAWLRHCAGACGRRVHVQAHSGGC